MPLSAVNFASPGSAILLPASVRERPAVEQRNVNSSSNDRVFVEVGFTDQESSQETDSTQNRIVVESNPLEPVLALEALPPFTRNALATYLGAQNVLSTPLQATLNEGQSIVGVDVFA